MRRRRMWVGPAAVAAILSMGCPPPEEAPPPEPAPPEVVEPPGKAKKIEPTDRPQPVSNARGLAEIVIGDDCELKDYSKMTFAERRAPQVWRVRSHCDRDLGVTVELRGFRRVKAYEEGQGAAPEPSAVEALARARHQKAEGEVVEVELLFDHERLLVELPALDGRPSVTRVLQATVLGGAPQGLYRYRIALNDEDQETQSPWAEIREPR